jgi:hypothetical protein
MQAKSGFCKAKLDHKQCLVKWLFVTKKESLSICTQNHFNVFTEGKQKSKDNCDPV